MTTDAPVPIDPSPQVDGNHEPCPTPLSWQDVLHSFDEQAQTHQFEAPHGTIRVTEIGDGPPIMVLPGLMATPRLFALTAWLLKDEFRFLLVDHPQWSKRPTTKKLIEETARLVAVTIRHLTPNGTSLYASSFGGQIALELMKSEPELMTQAMLQSSWAHRPLAMSEAMLLRIGSWLPGTIQRIPTWQTFQIQNHQGCFPPFDETRFEFLIYELKQARTSAVSQRLLSAAAIDLTDELSRITCPCTILQCEADGKVSEEQQKTLRDGLPNATSEWMHTSGLYSYLTHPHRMVKILRPFLSE